MQVNSIGLMTFAEKLAVWCEARGWNQAQLARKCKISSATASRWFSGERKPFDPKLVRLAEILGAPVEHLVNEGDERTPAEVAAETRAREVIDRIGGWEKAYDRLVGAEREPVVPRVIVAEDEAGEAVEEKVRANADRRRT
jgi:transcriptional regulator with XRE-family HTH domain